MAVRRTHIMIPAQSRGNQDARTGRSAYGDLHGRPSTPPPVIGTARFSTRHESLPWPVATAPAAIKPVQRRLGRQGTADRAWSQFWSHSPPSAAVHRCSPDRVRAGHGRWRTPVNGGAQYSKACEGASLPWVQIPPPPPLTCDDARTWWPPQACLGCFCLSFGHGTAVVSGQSHVSCCTVLPSAPILPMQTSRAWGVRSFGQTSASSFSAVGWVSGVVLSDAW